MPAYGEDNHPILHLNRVNLRSFAGGIPEGCPGTQAELSLMEPALDHAVLHRTLQMADTNVGAGTINGVEVPVLAKD